MNGPTDFPTTVDAIDTLSTESQILSVLRVYARMGAVQPIRELAAQVGIAPERLLDDAARLQEAQSGVAPDGHAQLAGDLLNEEYREGLYLRYDGNRFWAFDGQAWRAISPGALNRQLYSTLKKAPASYGEGKAMTIVAGARKVLEATQFEQNFPSALNEDPQHGLNTLSGEIFFYDDGDWEVRPHRVWSRSTTLCPVERDFEATCPRFEKALSEIFAKAVDPEGMVRHVLELMAYALQSKRDIPAIVILRGAGANGKSMLLRIWASLLGEDQVLWGSVARLSSDRFTLPDLARRSLFIDDDAKDGVKLDDGLLKSIAEDKPVSVRRAHAPESVSFRARALPVISMNGAPSLSDSSYGFERRLMVIPFDRRFTDEEMDRDLAKHIIDEELSGILNLLLAAYGRLRRRGGFDEPVDCGRAKVELLAASNPMRAFLSHACRQAEGTRITTGALYGGFKTWCRTEGRPVAYTRIEFTNRLKGSGLNVYKSNGLNCVADLELGQPAEPGPSDGEAE